MIASVQGVVRSIQAGSLVVEVGGVGLQVHAPAAVLDDGARVGRMISLFTFLAVREDSLTLYGFATEEQRKLFELLLSVSGVGPRLALNILSALSPEVLHNAVVGEQAEILSRVPGVGKKTAEKIVFHLKDRLRAAVPAWGEIHAKESDAEVLAALTALGYSVVEAQTALQALPKDAPDDVEQRVRLALQYFST